ncbi:MAG: hypothetical protein WD845_15435 [Pirellulales bacterium]
MARLWKSLTIGLLAAEIVCALAASASAQRTTYGEDSVPYGTEAYEAWRPYGSDPVPHSRIDNQGYVRAYGVDTVPGQPLNDRVPLRFRSLLPDAILPEQELEVLTSD